MNQEQRYQFRKLCRTFDEYVFCSYLEKIIPADPTTPFDLGDRVRLEYYNLEKTFEGSIDLVKEEKGVYEPAKLKKPVKMEETLSLLEQVIEKINQQYMGNFTDGDKVVITTLHDKLKNNKKLMKAEKQNVADALLSFMYGSFEDRRRYEAALNAITDEEKKKVFMEEWQDGRTSMKNIGEYAHQLGEKLKGKVKCCIDDTTKVNT